MVMPFLVLYLTQVTGFSIETAGSLLTVFGIATIFGAWTGGRFSDKIGAANVLILSFVVSAASMFIIPALSDVLSMGCALSVLAFANGAFRPAYDASVVRLCPQDERPHAYAVYVVAINIGAGIAAAIAGHLFAFRPSMITWSNSKPFAEAMVLKAMFSSPSGQSDFRAISTKGSPACLNVARV